MGARQEPVGFVILNLFCGVMVSTKTLWIHLFAKHKTEHDSIKKKKDPPSHGLRTSMKQPSLRNLLQKKSPYCRDHPKQKEFDKNFEWRLLDAALDVLKPMRCNQSFLI